MLAQRNRRDIGTNIATLTEWCIPCKHAMPFLAVRIAPVFVSVCFLLCKMKYKQEVATRHVRLFYPNFSRVLSLSLYHVTEVENDVVYTPLANSTEIACFQTVMFPPVTLFQSLPLNSQFAMTSVIYSSHGTDAAPTSHATLSRDGTLNLIRLVSGQPVQPVDRAE